MKKLISLSALIFGFWGCLHAQHLPLTNQYLINKFTLSPAFAGTGQTVNLFTGYRNQWAGVKGTPITKMINVNIPFGDKIGFGGDIISDQEGYFTRLYVSATYAYHVKISDDHKLSFALTGRVFEHSVDLTNATIEDPNDPVILNRMTQNETVVNAGFSALYRWNNLNVGFYSPFLFNNRSRFNIENDIDEFLLQRHYQAFASYNIGIGDNFSIEPFAIIRFTGYSPLNYEFASLFKYKNQVWIGASYRREGMLAVSTGFELNQRMSFNYTYEFLGNAMTGQSNGTHEFGIGFYIGKDIKKIKEDQLALQKTADSIATETKEIKEDQKKAAETAAKEKAKTDAKIEMVEQRMEDVEVEIAKAKASGGFGDGTGGDGVTGGKKKSVDEELLEIERKLKEVGGQFFVVVEAFKIPENAQKAIQLWAVKGLEVQMIYNDVRDFYYIYVGKYPTYNDALKVKTTLNENGIFGWIYLWKNK